MGQVASFTIGKKTKTDIQSDPVVLTNIKFKNNLVKETKAIIPTNGYYLKKSNLNSSSYGPNYEEEVHKRRFKKEITVLDNESQQLKEDIGLLDLSSSYVQNGDEREYKESYDKKITSLDIEVQQVKEEKKRMTASSGKKSDGSRKLKKDYIKRIKILEAEVQQLKEEKHKLFTRLSEMGAVRLTENNPNIADLSDDNRPDKLAEQISELYDNEWTDAFEYLTQIEGMQDEETVRKLLNILQTIYTVCLKSTMKQADDLTNAMQCYTGLPGETNNDFILKEVLKRLRECRATQFKSIFSRIVQDARDQLIYQLECKDCSLLDKYIQKCAHVCWFMCVKDPQIYLDFGQSKLHGPPDDAANDFPLHFDTTKFVSYTQAGMYVEYVVWPAVYLYMNGPIVKRGVAQGLNREPESTESTVKEKGENSINKGDTINVHTEQGYNAVNSSGDILKRDDGDGCISHNPPGTDDMAQETVKENAQNLKPDSNQHNDVSDTEYRHVSNVNTEVTNSDGNDGYARLSHASNESMEDENVLCQDEFHTEEFIFGNDVNLE